MFVTLPQFHQPLMSAVALGGQQHWNAVVASFPVQPWYLFVYEATFIDSRMNHTMLVAWEESLLQIISSVPVVDHRAVYRVEPAGGGGLAFKEIDAVWAPTHEEDEAGIGAVFRLAGQTEAVAPDLTPVNANMSRVVVFRREESATQFAQQAAH